MFPPHIARTYNIDRERRSPQPASTNGVKEVTDHVTATVAETGGHIIIGRGVGRRQRRWSLTASARHRRQLKRQLNPPVMNQLQGMRGRMPPDCIWRAFQALLLGLVLFICGAVMSYMGFETDGVFTNNGTAVAGGRAYFYEDARGANVKFSKLSYAGPIVMGVGAFIMVSGFVLTFEARDMQGKVGPAAYVASEDITMPYPVITRPRPIKKPVEVHSVGTQTNEHSSSDTLHIFDKRNLIETFRKFSRTVRQSSSKEDDMQRYPSAPNLLEEEDPTKPAVPKPLQIAARRSSCLPKFRNRVPPVLMRQALSIDCSSSTPFIPINQRPTNSSQTLTVTPTPSGVGKGARRGMISRAGTTTSECFSLSRGSGSGEALSPGSASTSRAVSCFSVENPGSSGSGSTVRQQVLPGSSRNQPGTVDLHLPNGMVTLNVIHTTGGSVLGGSSHCIRTLSPYPSYHSQSDDSFDMGSVKSDNILIPKSPMKPYKYRSESFGRPALVRQSKVDQAEAVIYMPESDDEQKPIPEAEHESDTDTD